MSLDDLLPGAVLPLLETRRLGREYRFVEEISSTNDEAARLAEAGCSDGTVVVTERQTRGRGRLGRIWRSEPGESLVFSTVLRPNLPPETTPLLGLTASVGLLDGISPLLPSERAPRIKWPNDLLVDGRKVSGLLLEVRVEAGHTQHIVLGVGVNANQTEFPEELVEIATSLRLERGGVSVERARLLASLLLHFERWLDTLVEKGPRPILEAWHARAAHLGEEVAVRTGGGAGVRGVALGLDETGALRIRLLDGTETTVVAGDLAGGS